ncbi:hypothetical protein KP004_11785 [Geomonas oryzisoli]|uniref:Uncharacterized protein n=1 Tax=Geomonas oryzisoli TaxID=2847992 RepID=A0ABX8J100_9BACT|nr:hypothetical protein [Geomonas oryzisoli]QWV91909.1 hypothetical protein KP004_11785 [Geomonas oryzisoli]
MGVFQITALLTTLTATMALAPSPVVTVLFMAAFLAALEQLNSRRRLLDVLSLATVLAMPIPRTIFGIQG